MNPKSTSNNRIPSATDRAVSTAIILLVFLLTTKAFLVGWYWLGRGVNPLRDVHGFSKLLIFGYDVFLCSVVAAIVFALQVVGRTHRSLHGIAVTMAVPTMYCLLVLFTVASFQITRIYQSPLDVSILRSGDDLMVIRDSIGAYLDFTPMFLLAFGLLAYPLLSRTIARRLAARQRLCSPVAVWVIVFGFATTLPAAEFAALRHVDTLGVKDNAVVTFIRLYEPPLRPLDVPKALEAFDQKVAGREAQVAQGRSIAVDHALPRDYPAPVRSAAGMNLLMIQMESTTASQVDPLSAPNVTALAKTGVRFLNHLTTFTETSRATYSVQFSDYMPDLGTQPSMVYGEKMPQVALAEVLSAAGYRTGVFHPGFLDYMEMRYYLANKGFQTLASVRELKQKGHKLSSTSGMREEEAVEELEQWIASRRDERFAAVYMTLAPHHPYHAFTTDKPFDESTWLGRYRNSLHYTDAAVGQLVGFLREQGLLEKTLIVVYADHGETVSTYPVGHGLALSAEELVTPMIVSNPVLFPTSSQAKIFTNHLDIAPTIVGLLGLKPAPEWLGRDLFKETISPRLLFTRVHFAKKSAVIDNGVMYAVDERSGAGDFYEFHEGIMRPLPTTDVLRGRADAYGQAIDLFRAWNVQHHLGRATGRPPLLPGTELLHDSR